MEGSVLCEMGLSSIGGGDRVGIVDLGANLVDECGVDVSFL